MTAWFSGCLVRPLSGEGGILTWSEIRKHIRNFGPHNAPTSLIEVENTHNMGGGTVYPMETLNEICDNAHDLRLKVHLDGSRIFNAAAYLNLPASVWSAFKFTHSVEQLDLCCFATAPFLDSAQQVAENTWSTLKKPEQYDRVGQPAGVQHALSQ